MTSSNLIRLFLLILLVASLAGCQDEGDQAATRQPATAAPDSEAGEAQQAAGSGVTPEPAEATEAAPAVPTETPAPTPTPLPPKDLVVCMAAEPVDLYLYGDGSYAANSVRQALYEAPVLPVGYQYEALALTGVPSLAGGDARLEPVVVEAGDLVVNTAGEVVPLETGVAVRGTTGQPVTFEGEPLAVQQLVVDSEFQPLVWSDGVAVTAADSVFSYEVAASGRSPQLDARVGYTASYEATGDHSVRWTGLPGFHEPDYATYVWTPLPRHQLGAFDPLELPDVAEAARTPLSYGAFVVAAWNPGEEIRLEPNPAYYRAAEGLPHLTSLTFRFLEPVPGGLPLGVEQCGIVTQDLLTTGALPALDEAAAGRGLVAHTADAGVLEYIIFGVDSTPGYARDHLNWFGDTRVRQAIAQCIDRESMTADLIGGQGRVAAAYVPPAHPLLPADLQTWAYNPSSANALLDEAGFAGRNEAGVRIGLENSQPFSITLGTNAESDLRLEIIARAQNDLAQCGIQVNPFSAPAATWFASGPDGPVFGRAFDLAQFAWLSRIEPECELFTTGEIPGSTALGHAGWDGVNVSGWSSEAYDAACGQALSLLPGQAGYDEAHQTALRLFATELPALPLFARLRVAAAAPEVVNFRLDPSVPSELWNVFELDLDTAP